MARTSWKLDTTPSDLRDSFGPEIASLLGHMTIHWSYLEFQVQTLLWELTENPEIGDILSRKLGMERWLDDIYLVARHRIKRDKPLEEWSKVRILLEGVKVRRNDLVHNLYAATFSPHTIGQAVKKTSGKKLKRAFTITTRTVSVSELDQLIKDIYSAIRAVATWSHKHVRRIGSKTSHLPTLRHHM